MRDKAIQRDSCVGGWGLLIVTVVPDTDEAWTKFSEFIKKTKV